MASLSPADGKPAKTPSRTFEEESDITTAMLGLTKSIEGILTELTKVNSRINDMDTKLDSTLKDVSQTVAAKVRQELQPDFDRVNGDLKGIKDRVDNIETDVEERLSKLERGKSGIANTTRAIQPGMLNHHIWTTPKRGRRHHRSGYGTVD